MGLQAAMDTLGSFVQRLSSGRLRRCHPQSGSKPEGAAWAITLLCSQQCKQVRQKVTVAGGACEGDGPLPVLGLPLPWWVTQDWRPSCASDSMWWNTASAPL